MPHTVHFINQNQRNYYSSFNGFFFFEYPLIAWGNLIFVTYFLLFPWPNREFKNIVCYNDFNVILQFGFLIFLDSHVCIRREAHWTGFFLFSAPARSLALYYIVIILYYILTHLVKKIRRCFCNSFFFCSPRRSKPKEFL